MQKCCVQEIHSGKKKKKTYAIYTKQIIHSVHTHICQPCVHDLNDVDIDDDDDDYDEDLPKMKPVDITHLSEGNRRIYLSNLISRRYRSESRTLDLSQRVKDMDIVYVLQAISDSECYEQIGILVLSDNQLTNAFGADPIRFTAFPPNLKALDLSNNQLSGLDTLLNWLPSNLELLCLQNNAFEENIPWTRLPDSMRMISVSKTMADSSMDSMPKDEWGRMKDDSFVHAVFQKKIKNTPAVSHRSFRDYSIMKIETMQKLSE